MHFDKDQPSVDFKDWQECIRARRASIHEKLDIKETNVQGGIAINMQKGKEIERNQVFKRIIVRMNSESKLLPSTRFRG